MIFRQNVYSRMTELHGIIIGFGRNRLELADSLPTASPLPKQTAEPPVKDRAWSLTELDLDNSPKDSCHLLCFLCL